MSNVFLNALQLNTSDIQCNITGHSINKPYIVHNEAIYGKTRGVVYPASGNTESYEFQFSLIAINTGNFTTLLQKGKAIYTELLTQVSSRVPILIKTNDTPIYLNFNEVYVVIDEFTFKVKATDGIKHLNFTITASVLGAPIAIGGTVDPNNPWD